VTCDDFLAAMADANGEDLSALSRWEGWAAACWEWAEVGVCVVNHAGHAGLATARQAADMPWAAL
jgi:hypothetical protein